MQTHPGDALPEVKKEEELHLGDSSPKVNLEDASHPGDASPKGKKEEESHLGDSSPKVNMEDVSHPADASPEIKKEEDDFTESSSPSHLENTLQNPVDVFPLEDEEEDQVQITEDEDDQLYDNAPNQLVVYNPEANDTGQVEPIPEPIDYQPAPFPTYAPNPPSRVLPCVGAFTVQCANCFKWRLIPTKEKYEEIRESILQQPFVCERAREWRPSISCDDPADISQDGSRLWAIDKPNIAQPPPGWERLLRIRGEGSTKFADVYYVAPSGKRLRSMVEVQKFLLEHPEYIRAGVTMAQFSFQIPKPLQENYVRKRPARVTSSYDGTDPSMSRPLELTEVNPLSWASPVGFPESQVDGPGLSTPYFESPLSHPVAPPTKKRSTKSSSRRMYSRNQTHNQPWIKVQEEPQPSRSSSCDV